MFIVVYNKDVAGVLFHVGKLITKLHYFVHSYYNWVMQSNDRLTGEVVFLLFATQRLYRICSARLD